MTYRRLAGSLLSCQRASATADGRAYLASDATEVYPDFAMSIGVLAPASGHGQIFSLAWVSIALMPMRHWQKVRF